MSVFWNTSANQLQQVILFADKIDMNFQVIFRIRLFLFINKRKLEKPSPCCKIENIKKLLTTFELARELIIHYGGITLQEVFRKFFRESEGLGNFRGDIK